MRLLLLGLGLAGVAHAHARLVRSEPARGETVAPPRAVRLFFDSQIERSFHELELVPSGEGARPIPLEGAVGEDPTTLSAPVPALAPGPWTVRYEVVSRDGHRIEGDVRFVVR